MRPRLKESCIVKINYSTAEITKSVADCSLLCVFASLKGRPTETIFREPWFNSRHDDLLEITFYYDLIILDQSLAQFFLGYIQSNMSSSSNILKLQENASVFKVVLVCAICLLNSASHGLVVGFSAPGTVAYSSNGTTLDQPLDIDQMSWFGK